MSDEVLATVSASPTRRWAGFGMLLCLGALIIYLALGTPMQLGWKAFLIVTGILSIWMAERVRRATAESLELTETELRSTDGEVLARISDIANVERGAFSFKPSNGFLITMNTKAPSAWRPGLWWRLGKRIGIGGVAGAAQTKFMSEMLSAQVLENAQESDHTT